METKIERMVRLMSEKAKSKRGRKKKIKGEPWSLYILQCGDGSLYTGVTNDLTRRFEMHSRGKGSKYTRSHLPVDLVYSEICGTRVDALVREIKVKRLPREKKEALIGKYVFKQ